MILCPWGTDYSYQALTLQIVISWLLLACLALVTSLELGLADSVRKRVVPLLLKTLGVLLLERTCMFDVLTSSFILACRPNLCSVLACRPNLFLSKFWVLSSWPQ